VSIFTSTLPQSLCRSRLGKSPGKRNQLAALATNDGGTISKSTEKQPYPRNGYEQDVNALYKHDIAYRDYRSFDKGDSTACEDEFDIQDHGREKSNQATTSTSWKA